MCRLMALPSQMKLQEALPILLDMEGRNTDGFGFAYTDKGRFIMNKTALSLSECLKKKGSNRNILNEFPSKRNGWTIIHMRAATHGDVCARNAHPFVEKDVAMVHNGVFRECDIVKAAMGKDIKLKSETDSEVALNFYNKVGPKQFANLVGGSSVYLALQRDGSLYAIKTAYSADLKICKWTKNGKICFLSSELPHSHKFEDDEADAGWFYFDKNGILKDFADTDGKKSESKKNKYSVLPYSGPYASQRAIPAHYSLGNNNMADSNDYHSQAIEHLMIHKRHHERNRSTIQEMAESAAENEMLADAEMPLHRSQLE